MITYAVNGVALDDADGRWSLMKGSSIAPAVSAEQMTVKVPGIDGLLPVASEARQAPPLTFRIKVQGTTDATLRDRLLALLMTIAPSRGSVTLARSIDGVLTYTAAKMESISEPEYAPARSAATVTVTYRLPQVYWRQDADDWTQAGITSGTGYTIGTLADTSAPIYDARILVTGPITNPKVTDTVSGEWALLTATIASGEAVLLDCKNWLAYRGSSTLDAGDTGATGLLTTSGGPYMLPLAPEMVSGNPANRRIRLSVTGSGFTSATALSVRAAKAFLL